MESDTKILIIEDDESIIEGLEYVLEKEGFYIEIAKNKREAYSKFLKNKFDIFIVDVQLPDGTGFEICKYIKKNFDLPVILASAVGEEANVVYGLDLGADDFIVKPYRNNELIARINCVLRRDAKNKSKNVILYRNIKVDLRNAKVIDNVSGEEIILSTLEYKLLLLFLKNRNRLITRQEILEKVWDIDENYVNDNTLSVYIKRLRNKISNKIDNSNKKQIFKEDKDKNNNEHTKSNTLEKEAIKTIRGIGYILND